MGGFGDPGVVAAIVANDIADCTRYPTTDGLQRVIKRLEYRLYLNGGHGHRLILDQVDHARRIARAAARVSPVREHGTGSLINERHMSVRRLMSIVLPFSFTQHTAVTLCLGSDRAHDVISAFPGSAGALIQRLE